MRNPHGITGDFEDALCEYTGATYAVTTNSCTMALLLAVAWHTRLVRCRQVGSCPDRWIEGEPWEIEIPKRTYVSVPMAIIHAGGRPTFRDQNWSGAYRLEPLPVWDSARLFTCGMYRMREHPSGGDDALTFGAHPMMCVSFHASKTLGLEQGGAILHDDPEADAWLRRARFDGRTEGVKPEDDTFRQIGWHCYMNPSTAAQGILHLHSLPRHNAPLPNDDYPDLSTMEIFK